ncbi:MAG: SufD family Fe-S cluster assembly protein [Clostridia bacterium]|nr:SufD family Fe-S cluster assembly protein [Clostridia bacterium]
MIKINKSPAITTSHYGTNYHTINDDVLSITTQHYEDVVIKNFDNENCFDIRTEHDESAKNNLSQEVDDFVATHTNFKREILVKKSTKNPIMFEFLPKQNLVDTITLIVEKDVKAKAIFKYVSNEVISHFLTLKIVLRSGAMLDFAEFFGLCNSKNFVSVEVVADANSQINFFVFDTNLSQSVQNIKVIQNGDGSKANINLIYFAGKEASVSQNYLIEVFGKNCTANIKANGVLKDSAQKNFVGTIDFKQGSKKSVGEEDEICTLLSKFARSKSTPVLLCHEEDVDGKHSSVVNRVDDEELFYVMSRGMSENDAKSLLIRAKLSKQVSQIFDEDLKAEVFNHLDEFVK